MNAHQRRLRRRAEARPQATDFYSLKAFAMLFPWKWFRIIKNKKSRARFKRRTGITIRANQYRRTATKALEEMLEPETVPIKGLFGQRS